MVCPLRGQFQPAIAVQRVPMRFVVTGKLRNPFRLDDVTVSDLVPGPSRDLHQIGLLSGQQVLREILKVVEFQLPEVAYDLRGHRTS
jgi:hypothetical protein